MQILKEFRDFAIKGNAVDMAVGIILGAAFGGVVKSIVEDIIMPPLGAVTGAAASLSDKVIAFTKDPAKILNTVEGAKTDGLVAIRYGALINVTITFIITAFAIFMLVKAMNKLRKKEAAAPPPAGPTPDQKLLMEIRDAIKAQGG